MACGSCGGAGNRTSVTTGMVNAAKTKQRYQVNYASGGSETFDEYVDAVRAKNSDPGSTLMSVR